ncbi:MAG: hypothetical protein KC493_08005 [Bacteriovoracaceae bacterium]|nr:hypothetical protein [Bacteriovoracaceae bacterium]
MRKLAILLVLFMSTAFAQTTCQQFLDDCSYYSCIEEEKQCGRTGYPIGFGKKYCLRFQSKQEKLSKSGQKWMKDVRSCLINGLEESPQNLSCKEFKSNAVALHVPCYVNSGYCQLSKKDKRAVIRIIRKSLWRPSLLIAGIRVLRMCH